MLLTNIKIRKENQPQGASVNHEKSWIIMNKLVFLWKTEIKEQKIQIKEQKIQIKEQEIVFPF